MQALPEHPSRETTVAARWDAARATAFLAGQGYGPCAVTPLPGGVWNDVFLARGQAGDLVLKHFPPVPHPTLFPNLPEAEALALRRLAGLGVAPDLKGFWPEARVLVYAHLPGAAWRGDVAAVADLMRRKEAADPSGFRAVPLTPAAVLAEGDAQLARAAGPLAARWHGLRPTPQPLAPPARLSLIHTDVSVQNLIAGPGGLRLIDWQCPAAGDLAEDAFSFLSPAWQVLSGRAPLSPTDRAGFLAALGRPDVVARLAVLEPCYAYRLAAYCCWRAGVAETPGLRASYAAAAEAQADAMTGVP